MKLILSLAMGLCLAVSLAFAAPVVAAPGNDGDHAPRKERLKRAGDHKPGDMDRGEMRKRDRHDGKFQKAKKDRKHKKGPDDKLDRPHKDKKHKMKGDRPGKKGKHGKGMDKRPLPEASNDRDVWLKRAASSELLSGKASWYGPDFQGGPTASGVKYDMYTFTAAHRTLPMGTIVKVTDANNGKNVLVCVTDRGPFVRGRVIDLSVAAANQLDMYKRGVANVNLEVVSDEKGIPLKDDQAWFIRYKAASGQEKVGPFRAFADAAAMHEALRQAHPEAEVIVE